MTKPLLITLALAVLFIAGCKKDSTNKPSSGSVASTSYSPVTSGSTWRYKVTGGGGNDTLTIKMTGATATINGKTYYSAASTSKINPPALAYYYAANHIFAFRGSNAAAGVTIELQLLNDTLAVGHSFATTPTDDGEVNGVPARTINTLQQKNMSKTVGGKTFANVMYTQIDLQYDLGSGFESVAIYDVYVAKGIGMIEVDTSIFGSLFETSTIMDYTIK